VDLQNSGTQWHEREFSENPNSWFEKLQQTGVTQLRARYISTDNEISDRMTAGFIGGGGRWLIEAVKSNTSDFWEASWEVGNQDDPERNIWHVKYGRILRNTYRPESPLLPVNQAKDQLLESLCQIREFAYKRGFGNFGECFNRGINALTEPPFSSDKEYKIFPDGYAPPEYHQLLNACQRAWVFGGMGSWNDIGFDEKSIQKEYEALSDRLFNIMNLSLVVASNPFPRPEQKPVEPPEENSHMKIKKWWQFWK
jgi:hypothetical protein